MGSYNISGFYSHLPIMPGDEIGVFVCANVTGQQTGQPIDVIDNIVPLAAPVFCTYDDSGYVSDAQDCYTKSLFEEVIGYDFEKFVNNVSSDTERGIDPFFRSEPIVWDGATGNDGGNELIEDDTKEMNVYFQDLSERQNGAAYIVISEHRFVIEHLCGVSMRLRDKYILEENRFEAKYDRFVGLMVENGLDGRDLNMFTFMNRHTRKCGNVDFSRCPDKMAAWKLDTALASMLPDDVRFNELALGLYRRYDRLDYARLKEPLALFLDFHNGLRHMHGMFQPSMYAGQDVLMDDFISLYSKMTEKLRKDE